MAQDRGRSEIQKKTFTRWINTHLADRNLKVEDLTTDLCDGVLLCNLLEIISGKRIRKYNKKPKMFAQKLENLNKCIKFIKKEGITIVNIGANDINTGNLKIILGLIWTLILRYQINKAEFDTSRDSLDEVTDPAYDSKSPEQKAKSPKKSPKKKQKNADGPKKELIKWVNQQLEPYNQSIKNFKKDWKNPMILCALTDSLQPGLMDLEKVNSEGDDTCRTKDIQEAMSKAKTHFDIPEVMDASDMAVLPDELSIMTYVSYFRDKNNDLEKARKAGGQSFAEGPGLETGIADAKEERVFTVHALNNEGHPMTLGDDDLEVRITDPQGNDVKIASEALPATHPGDHLVKYIADKPGQYMISIKVKGAILKGFPKEVLVNPAASSEIKSCKFTFTIYAANEDGEQETEGGDLFEVELKNENGEVHEVSPVDNGDGSYTASYNLYHGHLYKVYANLNGEPIANSPFIHDMRTDVDKSTYVY